MDSGANTNSYRINTLHRGRYMLSFFVMLLIVGGLSSWITASEIVKIVVVLFAIPGILYVSVRLSQRPSVWTLSTDRLCISFLDKTFSFPLGEIDHIRCLTRSGGNLYVVYRKKKATRRFWRNKLFQADDQHDELLEVLEESKIDFYKF